MENLELLKQDWKKEKQLQNFSKEEIYRMIHSKSVSVVKNLFIIGLIEVFLWSLFDYYDGFDGGIGNNILTIIKYIQLPIFILLIIWSYINIRNEVSAAKLIKNILLLRKIIIGYIILVFVRIIFYSIYNINESGNSAKKGYIDALNSHNNVKIDYNEISSSDFYVFVIICTLIFIALLILIYNMVYGSLLQKLKENYKELTKIESDN